MDSEQLKREILAQMQLQREGSVMAKEPQQPLFGGHPVLDPLVQAIGQLLSFGPNPVDAFQGAPAAAAGIGGLLQSLFGEGNSGANEAGIYRQLGMQRAGGLLNPAEYLQRLQELPNYQRYLQKVQAMVKRGLGESFPVARGKEQVDPLMQALQRGLSGEKLPPTAVTYGPFGDVAENFARGAAEKTRKPAYVARGEATPADVAALVPRRQAYGHEAELVLKPTQNFRPNLDAKYVPPSGQFPWVERKALNLSPSVDPTTQELMQALVEAAKPPQF